ncbi:MAG: phosphotransferase enzyme family protein [Thermotogota bacterium]
MEKVPNKYFLDSYSIKEKDINFVGGFMNDVYEVKYNNQPYILRIGSKNIKSKKDVQGEIDFVNFLKAKGSTVCGVEKSPKGELLFETRDEIAVLFEKAKGEFVKSDSEYWNENLFFQWGKTLGKMNRFVKEYNPPEKIKRYEWYDDPFYTPEIVKDEEFQSMYNEYFEKINGYPKDRESYGLIHSDLHHGNFMYDGDDLYMFDFDDATYHYFIHDIAMPIFYAVRFIKQDKKQARFEFAEEFFTNFMKGYFEENDIQNDWLYKIPEIFKFRELVLIMAINKQIDLKDINNKKYVDYIEVLKKSVKNNEPYIDGFEKIIEKVIKQRMIV